MNALHWRRSHSGTDSNGLRVLVSAARVSGVVIWREQRWRLAGSLCADPEAELNQQADSTTPVPADERVVLVSERYWTTDRERASSSWRFALDRHLEQHSHAHASLAD